MKRKITWNNCVKLFLSPCPSGTIIPSFAPFHQTLIIITTESHLNNWYFILIRIDILFKRKIDPIIKSTSNSPMNSLCLLRSANYFETAIFESASISDTTRFKLDEALDAWRHERGVSLSLLLIFFYSYLSTTRISKIVYIKYV
jgi:hypothetical protein